MTKGEQTRQKIVAAAAPIFNERGYEGASMADLMAATGLEEGRDLPAFLQQGGVGGGGVRVYVEGGLKRRDWSMWTKTHQASTS